MWAFTLGFPGGSDSKVSACNVGDLGSIPESGRYPGEGNGNPLQYSTWKIPWSEEPGRPQSMGSQNWTRLSDFTFFHFACGHAVSQLQLLKSCPFPIVHLVPLSKVCCCSVVRSCPILCDCSTPGFPVLHHLLGFVRACVH